MKYIVIVSRTLPDPEEVLVYGPFDSEAEAEEFINSSAPDDVEDWMEEPGAVFLFHDDVEHAEILRMTEVGA